MSVTLDIIVLLLGLLLVALEIVAIPGGVVGICGGGLLVFGIWESFLLLGPKGGLVVLLCCAAICALLIAVFMKAKTWRRFTLNEESDSAVNQVDNITFAVGAKGVTIARLAPTGKALIEGQQVEVHAVNKYIDPDRPIEVVAVDGYRIDVKESTDNRFDNQ